MKVASSSISCYTPCRAGLRFSLSLGALCLFCRCALLLGAECGLRAARGHDLPTGARGGLVTSDGDTGARGRLVTSISRSRRLLCCSFGGSGHGLEMRCRESIVEIAMAGPRRPPLANLCATLPLVRLANPTNRPHASQPRLRGRLFVECPSQLVHALYNCTLAQLRKYAISHRYR